MESVKLSARRNVWPSCAKHTGLPDVPSNECPIASGKVKLVRKLVSEWVQAQSLKVGPS